jgi:ketosteroid isomerase-like protein
MDTTDKATGQRSQGREVAVYHVKDGKIVREEFYYSA